MRILTLENRLRRRASAVACGALLPILQFLFLLLFVLLIAAMAQTQTYKVLYTFQGKGNGQNPEAGLFLDSFGNLYGTTEAGGSFGRGTVFELRADGKEVIVHNFWGGDGWEPFGPVILSGNALYGTAAVGGTPDGGACFSGCGAVFKIDETGKESVLYAFTGGTDGIAPSGNLVRDEAGNIYSTTSEGGDSSCVDLLLSCGVVFKVDMSGKETVLHTFTGSPDGDNPNGGLVGDRANNLYGVTSGGGRYGYGIVFGIDTDGNETVLYNFTGGSDGSDPGGPLLLDTAGNLYGTTAYGGNSSYCTGSPLYSGCGVVFKLDTSGKETVLYNFTGNPDSMFPKGGLARDAAGNLYGTTYGALNCPNNFPCGALFRLDSKGNETVLHTFIGGSSDGANPNGSLVIDSAGNLYGTAASGGDSSCGYMGYGCGVIFKLTP